MKTVFVDSNVFLRFLTTDDLGQSDKADHLLRMAAAGEVALVSSPPVLFEVAWTLGRSYGYSNERILDVLAAISSFQGLTLTDADIVAKAITLARRSGEHFADAYIAAAAQAAGADEIGTFNRGHFERLGDEVDGAVVSHNWRNSRPG